MKRVILRQAGTFLAALGVCATGCGGPKQPPSATTTPPGTPQAKQGRQILGQTLRVALVLDKGGRDDKSFNQAAYDGVMRAVKELGAEERDITAESESDYKTDLTTCANQGYDVVFAVGYAMEEALKEVAPQFPNVKFAIVDGNAPNLPNCAALQFKEEQGSFLAGFLAASMSKTKTIGFVGGQQIPLIEKFEAGYRAGAKTGDPAVKVISSYTQSWEDVSKGSTQAQQQIGSGADIIFHASGKCGIGVIQAIKEKGAGYYAIGVDRDQDDEAPGRVLTSMVKRLDNAVFDTIKRTKEGHFEPGVQLYDIKSGGIGLSEMRFTKKDIPAATLARLDKITKMIADGQVVPPTTLAQANAFAPPQP